MLTVPKQTIKGLKSRASKRSRCRLTAVLKYLNASTTGKIVDISLDGIALDLADPRIAAIGSKVMIECPEIGVLEGTVRWAYRGRAGIEYSRSSNAAAKVSAYFRFHHQEVVPVLKR